MNDDRILTPAEAWPHVPPLVAARFAAKVLIGTRDECWIWTGGIESDHGYARWRVPGGKVVAAHRWSFTAHHGRPPTPVGRHVCDIRCCVNPWCLRDGTQAENIADMIRRGAWTKTANTGPRSWPTFAYRLRDAARTGDRRAVRELLERPSIQYALF